MFLLAIIHKSNLYMVAPSSKVGFSHIVKNEKTITGVINDDKLLYEFHINTPSLVSDSSFFAMKENVYQWKDGGYDILIGTNERIYHINKDKTIHVSTTFKAVGDEADILTGAILSLSNLDISPEDKINIAMKAIECNNFEVIKV